MGPRLEQYEERYGKLLIENFTRPNLMLFSLVWLPVPSGLLVGIFFTTIDFSGHPALSKVPQWFIKSLGVSCLISVMFLVYRSRRILFSHGKCLFEKGILLDGAWVFNDDDNFLFFNEMNLALIAPTNQTALRTMMRIHTAGAGNSLEAEDSKSGYSRLIMNHEADGLLGQLVIVSGHHFRYEYIKVPLKTIRRLQKFRKCSGKSPLKTTWN
ncbi:MAG: hypothetical protein QW379_08450 [Thermoplasmata archaeon]